MVIEYIGSIIRNEVANRREQIYEKQVGSWRIVFVALVCFRCLFFRSWRDFFHPFTSGVHLGHDVGLFFVNTISTVTIFWAKNVIAIPQGECYL